MSRRSEKYYSMQFFLGMTFLVIGVTQLIHRLTSRGEDDGE